MKKQMEEARNLLESLTPLKDDCGRLCGAACCHPDEDGQGGVALFPGEEEYYKGADWARVGGRHPVLRRALSPGKSAAGLPDFSADAPAEEVGGAFPRRGPARVRDVPAGAEWPSRAGPGFRLGGAPGAFHHR